MKRRSYVVYVPIVVECSSDAEGRQLAAALVHKHGLGVAAVVGGHDTADPLTPDGTNGPRVTLTELIEGEKR